MAVPPPGRFELPLLDHRRESPTTMTFRFSTEGTDFRYLSNQAIRLSLPGVDDPWGAVRSFSLSSSPTEHGYISVTCKISDTPFKQALARLEPGARAVVYGPLGLFLYDRTRPAVFLAGGIGITPFRGMLRFAADTGSTAPRRLFYSARTPEEFVFRHELDELAKASPEVQVRYTVTRPGDSPTNWTGRVGRIDGPWVREVAQTLDRPQYFIAGLPEMVRDMVTQLVESVGAPESDIDYEVFRGF
jgi:glycine betaine catabolism B